MSKYEPLGRYLVRSRKSELALKFAEIEKVLGFPLPKSARRYAAWWSNNEGSHVQAQAWLAAGYHTEQVDLAGGKLVFARRGRTQLPDTPSFAGQGSEGFEEMNQAAFKQTEAVVLAHEVVEAALVVPGEAVDETGKKLGHHPAFGALKGMITILPGVDLTEPAFEDWERLYGE